MSAIKWGILTACMFVIAYVVIGAPLTLPDSEYYMHASRTFRNGADFRNLENAPTEWERVAGRNGDYFTTWTPLLPVMLAAFDDPLAGARVVNAIAFAVAVTIGAVAIRCATSTRWTAVYVVIMLIWLVSPYSIWVYALSEPLFMALTIAFCICLPYARQSDTALITLSLISTALVMQRYTGGVLVLCGAAYLAILSPVRAIAFLCAPVVALTFWVTRNHYVGSGIAGVRSASRMPLSLLLENLQGIAIQWGSVIAFIVLIKRMGTWRKPRL